MPESTAGPQDAGQMVSSAVTADHARSEHESEVSARGVDPRTMLWEETWPSYCVYFWERQAPERPGPGWGSYEWLLENVDIDDVLKWAHDHAEGRQFVVYARITCSPSDGPGLIRLLGHGPTDPQGS